LKVQDDASLPIPLSYPAGCEMYQGRLVEIGQTEQLFKAPAHPYTAVLVVSTPGLVDNLGELAVALDKWTAFKKDQIDTTL